jgi:hypothetical protein
MPRSRPIALLALLALAAARAGAQGAPPTLDELVARNVAARGGAQALHALRSLRLTGKLLVDDGRFELAFVQLVARPANVRNEASVQGLTQVEAFDGTQGWHVDPFGGRKDPERLSADDMKGLAETAADFDGPLVDWREKGLALAYLGTEDVDGTLAHKIRLTRPNGDTEVVWLDPDHFLEIRLLSQRIEHGVKVETETDLSDYAQVAGVWLPFSLEFGRKGSSERQKFIVRKAEANVPAGPALFAFPAAPAAR